MSLACLVIIAYTSSGPAPSAPAVHVGQRPFSPMSCKWKWFLLLFFLLFMPLVVHDSPTSVRPPTTASLSSTSPIFLPPRRASAMS